MPEELNNTEVVEETTSRVDKLLKLFEALDDNEKQQAFEKMTIMMAPGTEENTPTEEEGIPIENDETFKRFNAVQDKLQNF